MPAGLAALPGCRRVSEHAPGSFDVQMPIYAPSCRLDCAGRLRRIAARGLRIRTPHGTLRRVLRQQAGRASMARDLLLSCCFQAHATARADQDGVMQIDAVYLVQLTLNGIVLGLLYA
jgi:hypothetical protein